MAPEPAVGLGLGTTIHVCPFQCSIRVTVPAPFEIDPTAQMSAGEIAVIESSSTVRLTGGVEATVQVRHSSGRSRH
jgi:hypothetical protein